MDLTEQTNKIFKEKIGLEFFLNLVEAIVHEETCLADYSFIFYKLREDGVIIRDTSHKDYIDYINKNFSKKIPHTIRQLNNRSTDRKIEIYNIEKSKLLSD
ncbi:MAG: hypothetical protein FGM46_07535 [Ferruginibacter sp.]|nr:hypothetical protein [Ferruginibacter sp.]